MRHWTPVQHQDVFQKALKLAQQCPSAAAWRMAVQACMLAAVQQVPGSAQQVHDLVQALLSSHKLMEAHEVSKLYDWATHSRPELSRHLFKGCVNKSLSRQLLKIKLTSCYTFRTVWIADKSSSMTSLVEAFGVVDRPMQH